METVMGVIKAAEEKRAPVIIQFYSRLATTGFSDYLAPIILKAAEMATVPVCMHLDHGAGFEAAAIALKNGATGIMVDFSKLSMEENIENTKKAVDILSVMNIGVEGEIGHIGSAADGVPTDYTTVEEAKEFAEKTGVCALAVAVGTAHGKYKQAPKLAIERIKEIKESAKIPLVLHGGSGIPDDQIKLAIEAGIRKINFGTDICCSFLDAVFEVDRSIIGIDVFMREPIESVKKFAVSKIELLGADGRI
jgi:ketose-bisphosphate aldolase